MNADLNYLLCVLGGGVIFFIAWWMFCILVRNGIDGIRFLLKYIGEGKRVNIRRFFIGDWK